MKGLSFTLCFGSYGGFYADFSRVSWRICLGYVAVTVYFRDLEAVIQNITQERNYYKGHYYKIKRENERT